MKSILRTRNLGLSGLLFTLSAAAYGSTMPGCNATSTEPNLPADQDETLSSAGTNTMPDDGLETSLRSAFPDHAWAVLDNGANFAPHPSGYWHRWGAPQNDHTDSPTVGTFGALDVFLPKNGTDAIRLLRADGFEIRVREWGAEGQARSVARTVAYPRASGTSYWTATPAGAEEWLHLPAEEVRSDAPLALWEIEGGTLKVMEDGERAAVIDDHGVARIWITAPTALTAAGESLKTSLEAEGNRLSLYVDTDHEEVLVDPLWTTVAPMSTIRYFAPLVGLPNGKALVVAGYSNTWISASEVYNPVTNMWSSAGTAYPSAGHQAVLLNNGRVLAAGGYNGSLCLTAAMIYDPNTNTWASAAAMAVARCNPRATLLADGRVLVTGGNTFNGTAISTAELYNPATNTWSTIAPMSTGRTNHALVTLNDGRILASGGIGAETTAEIYDPATNTWSSVGPMNWGRSRHTMTLLLDGRVLVAGGTPNNSDPISTAEIYSPPTNTWTILPFMTSAHAGHVAVRLNSGSVLVTGGIAGTGPNGATTIAEVFNPATNTWMSSIPAMAVSRESAGGALLTNGKVLLAGGRMSGLMLTASAEVFSMNAPGDACATATDCLSGFCVDGVCCNSACGGPNDCQQCNAPGSLGTCVLAAAATVCRGAAGACDVAEVCDGVNAACPADGFVATGTPCRAAAGSCDVAESCTGMGAACPADGFVATGTVCRMATDLCDAPETCTGAAAACPNDDLLPMGTPCRPAMGACDVAEACTGGSSVCPPDGFVATGTTCRPAAGPCDVPEACSGATANCPMDDFAAAGTICRQANGLCDVAESCTGMAAMCPADNVATTGTICRPAAAACDVAEACDGATTVCPGDSLAPAGTSCRAAAGPCDAEETCDGTTMGCPTDALLPPGTVCRAAADACDVAETCTGSMTSCPADLFGPDGTLCDDGNPCSLVDSCKMGQCAAGTPIDCSAKDECENNGACEPATGACVAAPPKPDGTPCSKGSCQSGVCTPATSSSSSSSGTGGDGGAGGEGGSSAGGSGGGQTTNDGGCSCRLASQSESGTNVWVLAALAGIAARRGRRDATTRRSA